MMHGHEERGQLLSALCTSDRRVYRQNHRVELAVIKGPRINALKRRRDAQQDRADAQLDPRS